MRRGFRVLAFASAGLLTALALAVLTLALLMAAISGGWQRERVRALVEAALSAAVTDAGVPARIHLGALEGPLYPDATLRDLSLEIADAAPVRVRALHLRIDLAQLFGQRLVVVESLRIEGATLSVARDPERGWPWEAWAVPDESASTRAIALELRGLSIHDSRVELEDGVGEVATRLAGSIAATLSGVSIPRTGSPNWPAAAEISLDLEPGVVSGRALAQARLLLRLAGSRVELAPSILDSEFGRAQISGSTDLEGWLDASKPATFELAGAGEGLDLGVLLARPELGGAVSLAIRLEASHRPGEPVLHSRGNATVTFAPSTIGALRIDVCELQGSFADGNWTLEQATLEANSAVLHATGSGDLERMEALDLALEISDLHALAAIADYDLGGRASVTAKLAGGFREPNGSLDLDLSELRYSGRQIGALRARIASAGRDRFALDPFVLDGPLIELSNDGVISVRREADRIVLERASLRLPEARAIVLSGQLAASGAHELRVEIDALDLARASARFAASRPVGGLLSGTFSAKGALPRPALRGAATWMAPELEQIAAAPLGISFETNEGTLRADARLSSPGGNVLIATLRTPYGRTVDPLRALDSSETVGSVAGSDLDLALLGTLFPQTLGGIEGRGDIRIELRGGSPDPSLEGELRIADVSLRLPTLDQRLGPLDAHVRFTREAVRIEELRLRGEGAGHATLTGEVLLADLLPLGADLRVDAHAFPIRRGTTLRAVLDGSVTLIGPFDSLVAVGDVVARDLHYSLAYETNPLLDEITVSRGESPVRPVAAANAESPRFYEQASLDLHVVVPPEGRVSGEGADVAIGGQLRVRKSPSRPLAVSGRIETKSGSYRLRGKTFVVERGFADFSGRADLDPDLDLRARHRVRQISIFALIGGRASAPTIRLESDPPYPEHDVLALLLFGRTRQELDSAQAGALQSVLTETAGGAALAELSQRLAIPLPIDSLDVKTSETSSAPTIGVGRYVSEDIYVRYGQDIGSGESDVRVDWKFAPRWTIESGASSRGDSTVDLIWTYDY